MFDDLEKNAKLLRFPRSRPGSCSTSCSYSCSLQGEFQCSWKSSGAGHRRCTTRVQTSLFSRFTATCSA